MHVVPRQSSPLKRPYEETELERPKYDDIRRKFARQIPQASTKPTVPVCENKGFKMNCSLPPHQGVISFESYEEFEVHYVKVHTHRCSECKKNFPTDHFRELHIEENHDPLVEAKKAKGEKTYRCFVESCDKICLVPEKRRLHLIDKHLYPVKYDFQVVNTGIDGKNSMLRWKPKKPFRTPKQAKPKGNAPNQPQDAPPEDAKPRSTVTNEYIDAQYAWEDKTPDSEDTETTTSQDDKTLVGEDIETVTSKMSSLTFIPPSVRMNLSIRTRGSLK